jgi:hypothetical protein
MRVKNGYPGLAGYVATLALVAAASSAIAFPRSRDPVVLTGAEVPSLDGVSTERVVAFRYDGGWVPVPAQVDERATVDFGTIYNIDPTGSEILTYADTSTFTGADPVPGIDGDDEIVLRAGDAGDPGTGHPSGVVLGTGLELTLTDPLCGSTGRLYLFESDGSLDPAAGVPSIDYQFVLLSGGYKATYNTMSGPNPEDSRVTTGAYTVHFADRWIRDETAVTAGGATGVDILDRHKSLFAPGVCVRSEDTFSAGEGAMIVNRTGPIRALRGYVGANSGPTTHRIHAFYEEREDLLTVLRVHAISGVVDYWDYEPSASGMVYRDEANPAGVLVDGNPDAITSAPVTWQQVSGDSGTIAHHFSIDTDIPGFDWTTYYSDDETPPETQCTGDAYEYGASGLWETDPIPNTDPALGPHFRFRPLRTIAYGPPNQGADFAETFAAERASPIGVEISPYGSDPTAALGLAPRPSALAIRIEPNPARERVELRFVPPIAGRFRVAMYDVIGRLVARRDLGGHASGVRATAWDLRGTAPGTYFVRAVAADGSRATAKLVRLK